MKKLRLRAETIRHLNAWQLSRAAGGLQTVPTYGCTNPGGDGGGGGGPDPSFIYTCAPSACNEATCQPSMPNVCPM